MSLGIAIFLIALLWFLIVNATFRKVAAVALVVLALGGILIFAYIEVSKKEQENKRQLAKTYIKINQVELMDPRVSFSSYDGRPDRITGRAKNNSTFTLESVEVRLLFQDCLPTGNCETIGDEKEEISVDVPPSQSRDFNQSIYGPILSPKGKIEWSYQLISVSAHIE